MSQSAKTTTDHKVIQKWIEEHGGKPATVKGTHKGEDAGLLRVNFPGYAEDNLEDIGWEEFFKKFDESNLAFLYQDEKDSRFSKFVARHDEKK
jgi:hypothetical protein